MRSCASGCAVILAHARVDIYIYRQALRAVLALTELREARGVTQTQLAEAWEVSQANVSRVEHEQDLYLSTLSAYVSALGGTLELTAVFPDQTVQLDLPVCKRVA